MLFDDQRTTSSVEFKASIGVPTDERTVLHDGLVGRYLYQETPPFRKNHKLRLPDIQRLRDEGHTEIHVVYGRSPQKLEYFRLLRRGQEKGGFVHDPGLLDEFGLDAKPQEIPVVFTSPHFGEVFPRGPHFYDRKNSCTFCSGDGETAMRRKVLPDGSLSEETHQVACVPFARDPKNRPLCQYRKGDPAPCKISSALYFSILREGGDIPIGQHCVYRTTSAVTTKYILNSLQEIRQLFGSIAFVPCVLTVNLEATNKYDVYRVHLRTDRSVRARFRDVIEATREDMEFYGQQIHREPETDRFMQEFDAEFNPVVRARELESEGFFDDDDEPTADPTVDYEAALDNYIETAIQTPPKTAEKALDPSFLAERSLAELVSYQQGLAKRLGTLSDQDRAANREANASLRTQAEASAQPDSPEGE